MPKEVIQKPIRIDSRLTMDIIFTQCIRYLLDCVDSIAKASPNLYANGSQEFNSNGVYFDFKINPETGLPYIEAGLPAIVSGGVEAGGQDLTPTIEDLQRQITTLETKLTTLQSTVTSNKQTLDSDISSLRGSITALDTRVSALEKG